jgi:AAA15 family ATPase/GTPase
MSDVWKLIFQVAARLNVQVFATTHNWDCIEAFERAARENENANGELIHLMSKNDKVFAVLYDEQELSIVTQEMIEVR